MLKAHLLLAVLALRVFTEVHAISQQIERAIQFKNYSGRRIEVHWVHPQTGQTVLQSKPFIKNGSTLFLNSFVGHEFQLREMPSASTGECENTECAVGYATVSENEEQIVFIGRGVTVKHEDDKSKAKDASEAIISFCTSEASAAIASTSGSDEVSITVALDTMEELTACIENSMTDRIRKANEEVRFQAEIRRNMGAKWENYTCADLNVTSSEPVENSTWFQKGVTRNVHKMLDRDASKIYVVDDFISPEECNAMKAAAEPTLHRATTADGEGGSKISENRKAMQAGVKVPWHKEASGDPIATLSRRVYDFTNHVTGYGLEEHGQEDLMSIQYFGDNYERGEPPDRYTPHCDGECEG